MSNRNIQRALLRIISASGLSNAANKFLGGHGAILMLHHVRPARGALFAPNRHLEVTPEFLDVALKWLSERDFEFISMDELFRRLHISEDEKRSSKRFVALTFDDGARDNLDFALPVLQKHNCPATFYVTSGFADRTACPWWLAIEEVVNKEDEVHAHVLGHAAVVSAKSVQEKSGCFETLLSHWEKIPEGEKNCRLTEFLDENGFKSEDFCKRLLTDRFMSWEELGTFSNDPLVTIGAHTMTHPVLARLDIENARRQMEQNAQEISDKLGVKPKHFAYPYGSSYAAGQREFEVAEQLGFQTAVTTRGGVLEFGRSYQLHGLPRVSLNGEFQFIWALDALMSGLPFRLLDGAKRLKSLGGLVSASSR